MADGQRDGFTQRTDMARSARSCRDENGNVQRRPARALGCAYVDSMESKAVVQRLELSTGIELSYIASGPSGTLPVLLLHAWAESRRAFDQLRALLPNTVRVIAIDQRGHGDADVPQTGYSLTDFADDVEAFMEAASLPSAILLGVSSGGYVAQQVAVTNPQRVAGLVLVGSPRTLQGRSRFADEVDQLLDPVPETWVRDSLAWFPRFHAVPQSYIEDRVRDGAHTPAHVWRETFNGLCTAAPPTDTGTITCPTLIVWGDRDELLSREQQEDLADAIPDSQLVAYENTGHLVLWEQPERVARDLTAFVEGLA
jgi:pimeloyl-ACP methyl ester carboxylesterase